MLLSSRDWTNVTIEQEEEDSDESSRDYSQGHAFQPPPMGAHAAGPPPQYPAGFYPATNSFPPPPGPPQAGAQSYSAYGFPPPPAATQSGPGAFQPPNPDFGGHVHFNPPEHVSLHSDAPTLDEAPDGALLLH